MKLTWRRRRQLVLLFLVIGLPIYIILASVLATLLPRPNILLELAIYIGLGVLWAFPMKPLFKGISQPEPEEERLARTRR
jgi:predicted membrane channel-forming protein YqfA (hemolysin III family)